MGEEEEREVDTGEGVHRWGLQGGVNEQQPYTSVIEYDDLEVDRGTHIETRDRSEH